MKTFRELAEEHFSADIRNRFITNMKQDFADPDVSPLSEMEFVLLAFGWAESPEGHEFWSKINSDITKKHK